MVAQALAARARGALDEAESLTRSALLKTPSDPRVWVLHGSLSHLRGQLPSAIEAYLKAIAHAPTDAAAHAALAVAYTQMDRPGDARAHIAAACAAPSGLWSGLRILRLARELARHRDASQPWNACATPLFEAEHTTTDALGHAQQLATGRIPWTTDDLRHALHPRPKIVALTGAGISAASGLQTRKQLWQRFARDEAVSAVRFHADPRTLWSVIAEFWGDRRPQPNPAHLALARLPNLLGVISQNVDELHQAAAVDPSSPILELHGSLLRTRCTACDAFGPPATTLPRDESGLPPPCPCGGPLRPDVVLFGERVPSRVLAAAARLVVQADMLLVVGCAMDVSPASELPVLAALAGATVVEIKRQPSRLSEMVQVHHIAGAAEDVLPLL